MNSIPKADDGAPAAASETAVATGGARRPVDDEARRRAAGRFAVLNLFVDSAMRDLPPSAVKVWLVLYRDTRPDGIARAGQADIARRAGITDRAVRLAIANLKRRGLLRVVHRGRLRTGVSRYVVSPIREMD